MSPTMVAKNAKKKKIAKASYGNKPHIKRELKHMEREAGHLEREAGHLEKEIEKVPAYSEKRLIHYGRMMGPGLIAGAADDDAGGIATYSIVGATTGYALNWLLVISTPMLIAVQGMCARLGAVTHKGLATLMKENFGIAIAMFAALVLTIANIATISADIAGMSVSSGLLTGIQWTYFVIPLSLLCIYIILYKNFNTIQKVLIRLSLILLAYVLAGLLAYPDWQKVFIATVIPQIQFNLPFIMAAVGLLGTTITPYLFFWQTATEVEAHHKEKNLKRVDFDITAGMLYSNLISYFIIISSATVLNPHMAQFGDISKVPDPITFIAQALRPLAGDNSFYLFAVGLFAASMLAVIVLATSTAYVIAETFNWVRGLNHKPHQAKEFYAIVAASIALGCIILYAGVKPMDAMYYSQVLCGVADPVLLYLLIKLASDRKLMGENTLSGWWKWSAWLTFVVILGFVGLMFWGMLFP